MRSRTLLLCLATLLIVATPLGHAEPTKQAEIKDRPLPKEDASSSRLVVRHKENRAKLLERYGGVISSEGAVSRALLWLVDHQFADGSWSFDHRGAPSCQGRCGDPGKEKTARVGATGLALLALLGSGQSHKSGKYKVVISNGLQFLVRNMNRETGALSDGGRPMHSHCIATWALCDAYELSGDKELLAPMKAATKYLAAAQDPIGGGWRYEPRQPGYLSVTVWGALALDSAARSPVEVSDETWLGISTFLNWVQSKDGAAYGEAESGSAQTTSAMGLLIRQHRGWLRDRDPMRRGIDELSRRGPDKNNVLYNFFATQALFHYGGEAWKKWNSVLREQLIDQQVQRGHETGSWFFDKLAPGNSDGGRLFQTALCALMLETYYRYPRIFGEPAKGR